MEQRGLADRLRLGGHDDRDACLDQQPELGRQLRVERARADELDDRARVRHDRSKRTGAARVREVSHDMSVRGLSDTVNRPDCNVVAHQNETEYHSHP